MAEKGCATCKWEPHWEAYENNNLMGKCKWISEKLMPALPKCTRITFAKIVLFTDKDDIMNISQCSTWEKK